MTKITLPATILLGEQSAPMETLDELDEVVVTATRPNPWKPVYVLSGVLVALYLLKRVL